MKSPLLTLLGASLVAGTFASATPAEAQFRALREAARDVEKAADDTREAVETAEGVAEAVRGSRAPTIRSIRSEREARLTTRRAGGVGPAGPAPARFTDQLQCANLGIGNAFVGREGDYTYSQGISTQTRSGLIERTNVSASNGCFFPGLAVGDVLYVEFDKGRYDRHDYAIQCVSYDGSEQLANSHGPSVDSYNGKDVMLHTGNSLGFEPTATGTNSARTGAYEAYLDSRGRKMAIFNFATLHTDRSGTDFYCQWFNEDTGESAVAFTYRRGPAR